MGGLEIAKIGQATLEGAVAIEKAGWELIKNELHYAMDTIVTGWRESLKLMPAIVEAADEITLDARIVIKAIILNLLSYAATGLHQLTLIIEEGIPVLSAILLLSKELIVGIAVNLMYYLTTGWHEAKKIGIGALSALDEATSGLRALLTDLACSIVAMIKSGVKEGEKCALEATASLIDVAKTGVEIKQRILLEVLNQIQTGTAQATRFLSAVAETAGEISTPLFEVIDEFAYSIWLIFRSQDREISRLDRGSRESLAELAQVPLEAVQALCFNLYLYLQAGGKQTLLWKDLLQEDLPDTFRILVQEPLEAFFAPKWAWVKAKFIELNEARLRRMEAIMARFEEIKTRIGERIEQLQRTINARLG